jgi:hypothetical protein
MREARCWTRLLAAEQPPENKKSGAEVRPGSILQFQFRKYSDLGGSVKQWRRAALEHESPFSSLARHSQSTIISRGYVPFVANKMPA